MTESKRVDDAMVLVLRRGPICERCVASHVGIPAVADLTKSPFHEQITHAHGMCRACKRRGVMVLSVKG